MTLTVPIVTYGLPDPTSFRLIHHYLYHHDIHAFLAALLPLSPTAIQHIVATSLMMGTRGHAPPANTLDVNTEMGSESEHTRKDSESSADEEMSEDATSSSSRTTPSTSDPVPTPKRNLVARIAIEITPTGPAAVVAQQQQMPKPNGQPSAPVEDLGRVAYFFAITVPIARLFQQAHFIQGVWSNAAVLGIADVAIWNAMNYAWVVTTKAMAFAMVLRRQRQQQQPAP